MIAGVIAAVLPRAAAGPGTGHPGRAFSIFSGRSPRVSRGTGGARTSGTRRGSSFTSHPLWGVGTGSFAHPFQPIELFPHNIFLETGAELGHRRPALDRSVRRHLRCADPPDGGGRLQATIARTPRSCSRSLSRRWSMPCLSSDITSNEALWLIGGLGVGLTRRLDLSMPRLDVRTSPAPPRRRSVLDRPAGATAARGARAAYRPRGRAVWRHNGRRTGAGRGRGGAERPPGRTDRLAMVERRGNLARRGRARRAHIELELDGGAVIVRSRQIAEAVGGALGGRPQPSRRRPWAGTRTVEFLWSPQVTGPGTSATVDASSNQHRRR